MRKLDRNKQYGILFIIAGLILGFAWVKLDRTISNQIISYLVGGGLFFFMCFCIGFGIILIIEKD